MKKALTPHISCGMVNFPPVLFGIAWYIAYCSLIVTVGGDTFDNKFVFYFLCCGLFQLLYSIMTLGFGTAGIVGTLFTFVVLMFFPVLYIS